jgi:hypothetical protein
MRKQSAISNQQSALVEVLTKVYGFTNRMKVSLSFKDIDATFKTLNELSEYLVSIDVTDTPPPPPTRTR